VNTTANIICGNTNSFSPFIIAEELSTAVTISNISAQPDGNQVIITWSTSFEIDNEGFVILRSESPNGPFNPITQGMIPAVGGAGKATYTFMDGNVGQGKTYYYRLQDIDSRGRVTAHQVIPVTVTVAKADEALKDTISKGDDTASVSPEPKIAGNKNIIEGEHQKSNKPDTWVSVIVSDQEDKHPVSDIDATKRLVEDATTISLLDKKTASQDIQLQEQPITKSALNQQNVEAPYSSNGPSSFSVSIEDDKGNIIMVSKVEDTTGAVLSTSDLEVTEDSGHVMLSWQWKGKVRGFILHRAEKGKDNYAPVSNMIPYFGQSDKNIFLYRFTDINAKPGVRYDYWLETVSPEFEMWRRN